MHTVLGISSGVTENKLLPKRIFKMYQIVMIPKTSWITGPYLSGYIFSVLYFHPGGCRAAGILFSKCLDRVFNGNNFRFRVN